MILGVDEVGRGCWAGPLVVGACVLPDNHQIEGLTDSKKLTAKQRLVLFNQLKQAKVDYGLGWVSATEIDQIGLSAALKKATFEAVSQIKTDYDQIIIDGTINFLAGFADFKTQQISTLKKADLLIPSVSAAAILAKVSRDQHMIELVKQPKYQVYGFEKHVGYGTKLHRQMLEQNGPTDIHRQSFKPIAKMLGIKHKKDISGSAKDKGDWGEKVTKEYFLSKKYNFLAQNWRTKLFEIDLVMEKDNKIYLIEVKTRKNNDFGGGIAAINQQKINKMQLAAQNIAQKYPQKQIELLVATITGDQQNYQIETIEI